MKHYIQYLDPIQRVPISDCWREAKSSGEKIMKKGRIWDGEREKKRGQRRRRRRGT
jgi:hypothetical protein